MNNLFMFAVLALLMAGVIKMRPVLVEPMMWYSIAIFGYVVCTSGFIYCTLHNMPMFRLDRDQYGNVYVSEYFMKQQRSQFAAEGYITSILAAVTSMIFLLVVRGNDTLFDQRFRKPMLILCIVLAYLGVELFLMCYRIKSPWYNSHFLPPSSYRRGPLARDQGTNI